MEQENAIAPEYYPNIILRKLFIGRTEAKLADYCTEEEGIELKSSTVAFSLRFVVPDYIRGADVEYSYMLEGYDKEWTPFNSITEASYSQVPVGDYVFKVRYKKDVFDTAYKTFSIPLHISPLWYQTTLARIIYTLLAILIILYVAYLLRRYFRNEQMIKMMRDSENKNIPSGTVGESPGRDLVNGLTLIYQMCDHLRAENTTYEQRYAKIELVRETVMSLLFSSDALSNEELTTLSPVNFTISGCLCLKELAEEVLQVFRKRGEDVSKIHIALSDSFSFEIYRNALRYVFYYIYFFSCHRKDGAGITIDATKEEGKMLLTVISEDGSVKELYEALSGQLPAMEADRMDEAFQMRIFQHFAQAALEQVCDGIRYEDREQKQHLTLTFSPVKATESSSVKKTVLLLEDCDEMVWLISNLLSDEFVVHRVKTIQAAFEYKGGETMRVKVRSV